MLLDFRNRIDFFLRSKLSWTPTLKSADATVLHEQKVAEEVSSFLGLFDWMRALHDFSPAAPLRIADVGAKNFFLAPALDSFFRRAGFQPEIHGIELDAHRRYRNFRTRAAYERYYAGTIPHGFFHEGDFLDWRQSVEVILMLNPFVSDAPLMAWGLPRKYLRPQATFTHAYHLLHPRRGRMLVSSPTNGELGLAKDFAAEAGFDLVEEREWLAGAETLQTKNRFGALFNSFPRDKWGACL